MNFILSFIIHLIKVIKLELLSARQLGTRAFIYTVVYTRSLNDQREGEDEVAVSQIMLSDV